MPSLLGKIRAACLLDDKEWGEKELAEAQRVLEMLRNVVQEEKERAEVRPGIEMLQNVARSATAGDFNVRCMAGRKPVIRCELSA